MTAPQALAKPPLEIVAGDSIDFLEPIPPDLTGWTGSARITGAGVMAATAVTTEGASFHVKFEGQSAGGTKTLTPGRATLTIWATLGSDRYTVAQYTLIVRPDAATGTPALAHAEKTLAIIEAAIENRLAGNSDGGLDRYAIQGQEVWKIPLHELVGLKSVYAAEVRRLRNPAGSLSTVRVTFGPTSVETPIRRFDDVVRL